MAILKSLTKILIVLLEFVDRCFIQNLLVRHDISGKVGANFLVDIRATVNTGIALNHLYHLIISKSIGKALVISLELSYYLVRN